ncbi:MAG TPA: hypothetical protein VFX19_00865 [Dehalococcoidia bacterium]|jgi:membrane protein implicated in regulation of membrane protease activity|nr:hypothetical protein [Dehalococcoidia bacterium]
MDKMLYWLSRWPWLIGAAVFVALTQAPLGPWYISAMFIIGAALVATSLTRRLKWQLIETEALRRSRLPVTILTSVEASSRI